MRSEYKRTRLLVDPTFQLRLVIRMCIYLLMYMFIVLNIAFLAQIVEAVASERRPTGLLAFYTDFLFREKGFLLAIVLTAPICLYDLLRFSNRVAGPLYRCRKVMQ